MSYTKRQVEIIKAATKLIGENGLQNLTTKKLAAEMAFSEPAIYRHFKNKSEILNAVLQHYKTELQAGLRNIMQDEKNAIDKIKAMIHFQFAHFTRYPAVIMVIFSETSFQYDNELSKVVLSIIQNKSNLVHAMLQSGISAGQIREDVDANQLTNLILGTMRFTVLKWRLSKYEFNLVEEGKALQQTIELLLRRPQ